MPTRACAADRIEHDAYGDAIAGSRRESVDDRAAGRVAPDDEHREIDGLLRITNEGKETHVRFLTGRDQLERVAVTRLRDAARRKESRHARLVRQRIRAARERDGRARLRASRELAAAEREIKWDGRKRCKDDCEQPRDRTLRGPARTEKPDDNHDRSEGRDDRQCVCEEIRRHGVMIIRRPSPSATKP